MTLRLVFGLHLHQPVGNFDHVFAQHVRDVYRPFLERARAAEFFPLVLHISGPLLEWLEAHESGLLDTVGTLASDGKVELLLSGFDEPILASLPRPDRLEQIGRMRAWLGRRFGVAATGGGGGGGGLWLTERVWQPELAADLADAGVEYTLVDDHHFRVSGFRRDQLHAPYRTESDGRGVALLAIDERLRYLIPFRAPEETTIYLRELRAAGHQLAVLADDGEKFGGWPGTHRWVYEEGWLDRFFRELERLIHAGEVALTTGAGAVRDVPSAGLAYLGTASYREMETWALPPTAQLELHQLEQRGGGETTPFMRGGHWPHFLVKYPEANRMHKTMVALSGLARRRGDPPEARRAIGRAQCNDAYWHGVFGGLYLPHLRQAIWRQLAVAERELRRGEALECEAIDVDQDGYAELWVHSAQFSALVSPRRGGAIETFVRFGPLANVADALTRRRESYHETALAGAGGEGGAGGGGGHGGGMESIHDIERRARITRLPPTDTEPRALLVDRVLPASLTVEDYEAGAYTPLRSWARVPMTAAVQTEATAAVIVLRGAGLEKRLRFTADGCLEAAYAWEERIGPPDACFAPELSLSGEWPLKLQPAAEVWTYTITTVSRSERGFEETAQGVAVTPRWPVRLGAGRLELGLARAP